MSPLRNFFFINYLYPRQPFEKTQERIFFLRAAQSGLEQEGIVSF